jgi:hypothetical protein
VTRSARLFRTSGMLRVALTMSFGPPPSVTDPSVCSFAANVVVSG